MSDFSTHFTLVQYIGAISSVLYVAAVVFFVSRLLSSLVDSLLNRWFAPSKGKVRKKVMVSGKSNKFEEGVKVIFEYLGNVAVEKKSKEG